MSSEPLLDVRPEQAFLVGHSAGAVGIPLEELAARAHELPAASTPLYVTDADSDRAGRAAELLGVRGHRVRIVPWEPNLAVETGPARTRLWQPSPFLVEALQRIDSIAGEPGGSIAPRRARRARRALDVACGSGRDAAYLALAGYEVEAIDLLPDALGRARDLARRNGVSIATAVRDLEREPTLSPARYDLVAVFRFLHRPLFPAIREAVAPGGFVVYETFHFRNREVHARPSNAAHLLDDGELRRAFDGFEILIARDAVEREGRFFAHLLARRAR